MAKVPVVNELQAQLNPVNLPDFQAAGVEGAGRAQASGARPLEGASHIVRTGMSPSHLEGDPGALARSMSGAVGQVAQVMQNIVLDMQNKANIARVEEAQNAYLQFMQEQKYNQETGWSNQHGKNALYRGEEGKPLFIEYGDNAQKKMQEILTTLGNAPQRAAFEKFATNEQLSQREQIMAHVNREFENHMTETSAARISIEQNRISTGDERDIAEGIAGIEKNNALQARLLGKDPAWLEAKNRQDTSTAIAQAVSARVDSGDLNAAAGILHANEGRMNGRDLYQVREALQKAISIQEGKAIGEQIYESGVSQYDRTFTGDPYASFNTGFNNRQYLTKLIQSESGGNGRAKNKDSTAYGYAQFIDSSWRAFGKSPQGAALKGNMNDAQWLAMRSDRNAAEIATLWLAQENKRNYYDKAGIPLNNATAYLGHFLGGAGAVKVYKAHPDTPIEQLVSQDVMKANKKLLTGKTAGDVVSWVARKMGVEGKVFGPAAPPPKSVSEMGEKEAKLVIENQFADDPIKAKAAFESYKARREANEEAIKLARAKLINQATEVIADGRKISDIPPTVIAQLDKADIVKLAEYQNHRDSVEQGMLKSENFELYIKLSNPTQLEKLSEDEILAHRADLGRAYTEQLITKKRSLENKSASEKKERIKLDDTVQKAIIKEITGLDAWNVDKKDKEKLANGMFFIQQRIDFWINNYEAAGEKLDQETLMDLIRADVKAQVTKYTPGKWWGTNADTDYAAFMPPQDKMYEDNRLRMWRNN